MNNEPEEYLSQDMMLPGQFPLGNNILNVFVFFLQQQKSILYCVQKNQNQEKMMI
jgi:hypothetical protein